MDWNFKITAAKLSKLLLFFLHKRLYNDYCKYITMANFKSKCNTIRQRMRIQDEFLKLTQLRDNLYSESVIVASRIGFYKVCADSTYLVFGTGFVVRNINKARWSYRHTLIGAGQNQLNAPNLCYLIYGLLHLFFIFYLLLIGLWTCATAAVRTSIWSCK